jgi:hypothetical protein
MGAFFAAATFCYAKKWTKNILPTIKYLGNR